MERHIVRISSINHINHDVLRVVTEKPHEYNFNPGQATDIALNREGWKEEKRPFTFTSLPDDDYLEFYIKTFIYVVLLRCSIYWKRIFPNCILIKNQLSKKNFKKTKHCQVGILFSDNTSVILNMDSRINL